MVREKLGPKPRPRQTLYLQGNTPNSDHGLSFWDTPNSDHGLSLGCFWGRGRRGGSQNRTIRFATHLLEGA